MFNKLDIKIELDKLIIDTKKIIEDNTDIWQEHRQLGLTHRSNAQNLLLDNIGSLFNREKFPMITLEREFNIFNAAFKDTYLHFIYQHMPFKVGRMRLMGIDSKKCYSLHFDTEVRYHIAIITNPAAFILLKQKDNLIGYHVPADGYVYEIDTRFLHTAMNAGGQERIHLVINKAGEKV